MKTILIEAVSNGWIVRPFQPCADWHCTDRPGIAVYNRLEDLQKDLPKLLEFTGYMNEVLPNADLHAAVGYIAPTATNSNL